MENEKELLEIQNKITAKRAEFRQIQEDIADLKNQLLNFLPFKVGDVIENKERLNKGFWKIESVSFNDDLFDRNGRLNRSLYCHNIKADGTVGAKTIRFHEYENVQYLGNYEDWLKSRK